MNLEFILETSATSSGETYLPIGPYLLILRQTYPSNKNTMGDHILFFHASFPDHYFVTAYSTS